MTEYKIIEVLPLRHILESFIMGKAKDRHSAGPPGPGILQHGFFRPAIISPGADPWVKLLFENV